MSDSRVDRRTFLTLGGSGLVAALAGCTLGTPVAEGTQSASGSPDSTSATDTAGGTGQSSESVYTQVYRETIDSVVLVQMAQGQGTGFVFDDGTVVTNAHVVGRSQSADVRFRDGQWSSGDVAGVDPHSDLAAITVADSPPSATPLPFVDGDPAVGQEVVAIGNPYNLDGSVTTGVISGLDRSIPAPTGFNIPDSIQTDAAVNPGNSGGPLVSLDARVVAVINSKRGDNIAFGISAALTQRVVPELVQSGNYDHPYMGVSFTNVTPDIARVYGLDEPRGLLIVRVVPGGPADGVLQPSTETRIVNGRQVRVGGDVMLAVDGTRLQTPEDLGSYLALETDPGQTVSLDIIRDGSRQSVDLELGVRPESGRQ